MTALVGFLMIIAIIVLLLRNKMAPFVVLTVMPVLAALLLGFSSLQIVGFVEGGVQTTMTNGILFLFSVIYFGVLSDTGLFQVLVGRIIRPAGGSVIAMTAVTMLIATVSCIDGATVTAILITVPALYPIYVEMNIDRRILLCLTGTCMSVMNLLPWSGPVARAATVLNMDLNVLWHRLIPVQLVGLAVNLILAVVLGILAVKQGGHRVKGKTKEEGTVETSDISLLRPRLLKWNLILTIVLVVVLVLGIVPNYTAFMASLCILLIMNYPDMKQQNEIVKKHAPDALLIAATLYASGAMVGVLNETGMLSDMAEMLVHVIPGFLGQYIHVIFGLLALPIGMSIGTDAYFYGVMPLAIELGEAYGIEAVNTASAMLIGRCLTPFVCPLVPSLYLGLSMAKIELKEHLKFSIPVYWTASVILLVSGLLLGIV